MRRQFYYYVLAASMLTIGSLTSCYYDNEEDLYGKDTVINDTTTVVSYLGTIRPMIDNNCATSGCHVAGAQSPDLTTYQGVFTNRDRVKSRAVNENPSWMPAAGPMSVANRTLLAKWIDAGAQNN